MHIRLLLPSTSSWNAEIDRIGALLNAPNNPTVFPYHFLQVVLPGLGGAIVDVRESGDRRARSRLVGFLLPRAPRQDMDIRRSLDSESGSRTYTLRFHTVGAAELQQAEFDNVLAEVRRRLSSADIVPYSPLQPLQYTQTERTVGNARIGRPSRGEAARIEALHQEIWNSPREYVYPTDIHSDQFALGTSLVARVDDNVAGFLFGFYRFGGPELPPAWKEHFRHDLRLESQVMGVSAAYRGMRLGNLLKRAQAMEASDHGMQLIHWTVDPLQYPNAALNFGLLRAISFSFLPDYYPFRNDLNRVPASRLAITWLIDTTRVTDVPLTGSSALVLDMQREFTRVNDGIDEVRMDASSDYIAIQIPHNWGELQRTDIRLAQRWREVTDGLFQRYVGIEDGQYAITGVAVENGQRYLIGQRAGDSLWQRLAL